jgi:sucrose-6-phosphate hydrolase SacC (GH32 family)
MKQIIELYNEQYRPQFHFTAQKNWLNDPNGLVYYEGEYHLFFQHNPSGIQWGDMHWGHAVSTDLIHWTELDLALKPDEMGTMYSGSAVVDWRNTSGLQKGSIVPLVALYTAAGGENPESAGKPFTQCLAHSSDFGRTWIKYAGNPVIPHVVGSNRDPKVIWNDVLHCWLMALYLDGSDFALFSSPNLKDWVRIQTLNFPGLSECPDLFPLCLEGDPSEQYWLFFGANGHYHIGRLEGRSFISLHGPNRLDYGANFYAVQTYSDIPAHDGRRIQIAWLAVGNYPEMPFNQQLSIPCVLTLRRNEDGLQVYRYPVSELRQLRHNTLCLGDIELRPDTTQVIDKSGDLLDIEADIAAQAKGRLTFSVRGIEVTYDFESQIVICQGHEGPLKPENGRIELRILVDRSSLEIFGNGGRLSMTFCILPNSDKPSIELLSTDEPACINSLHIHEMKSCWPQSAEGVSEEFERHGRRSVASLA